MNIDDFVEGGWYTPRGVLGGLTQGNYPGSPIDRYLFKPGEYYRCVKPNGVVALETPKEPKHSPFTIGAWAKHFSQMDIVPVETVVRDIPAELYDAFKAGNVTEQLMADYKSCTGKDKPGYMM